MKRSTIEDLKKILENKECTDMSEVLHLIQRKLIKAIDNHDEAMSDCAIRDMNLCIAEINLAEKLLISTLNKLM